MNGSGRQEGRLAGVREEQISAALHERADRLEVSAGFEERLLRRLGGKRAYGPGRRFGWRIALTMCLLVILSCATTFASGNGGEGGGWVTVSSPAAGYWGHVREFDDVPKLVEKLGYTPKYLASLQGGWEFTEGHISTMQRLDENQRRMSYVYKELYLDYCRGEESLCFVASNSGQSITVDERDSVREVAGVQVVYSRQLYRFVPPDYELTEEDREQLESGLIEMSYGSSQVEEMMLNSVQWVQDGVHYNIFGWDLELEQEDMLSIAADFIDKTKEAE